VTLPVGCSDRYLKTRSDSSISPTGSSLSRLQGGAEPVDNAGALGPTGTEYPVGGPDSARQGTGDPRDHTEPTDARQTAVGMALGSGQVGASDQAPALGSLLDMGVVAITTTTSTEGCELLRVSPGGEMTGPSSGV
jgi:hypothetical protein